MNTQITERRCHPRYLAPELSVSFRTGTHNDSSLRLVDFNRYGMGLESDQQFKIGEQLYLSISGGQQSEIEVTGYVCNRAKSKLGYRCGIQFLIAEDQSLLLDPSLMAIEQGLAS